MIPAHREHQLIDTLESLNKCHAISRSLAVWIVINQSNEAPDEVTKINRESLANVTEWIDNSSPCFQVLVKFIVLPHKHAGVGLARKVGMDDAIRVFERDQTHDEGIIICLDADCEVSPNYFQVIDRHFCQNKLTPGASIHFEHPLSGSLNSFNYQAIINYELFLRFYIHAQRWIGSPHAFQTVGSSMVVRSLAYQKQGGMNRRKAGEDFYFLNRIIQLGHFTEIKDCKVVPSPRNSDRVPFGTGKDVNRQIDQNIIDYYTTYSPRTFQDLKLFFGQRRLNRSSGLFDHLPVSIQEYIKTTNQVDTLFDLRKKTTTDDTFEQKFFQWFDAFQMMKFAHFSRDNFYSNVSIDLATDWLLQEIGLPKQQSRKEKLLILRDYDRNN